VGDARDDNSGRVGLIGKTLGRYRITAELGRGGMATVYRAFDPQLGRDVAVKVMHGTFTGRGDIEKRFRREAQAVAAIKHDSIVDIFDFAPGGDGEPGYIVTEIIQGPTLRQLMNDCGGRLLPEVATAIGVRLASALGAAHGHGIIHRDVKPDNVMIDCRSGSAVRVLLTDFGVARIVEDDTMTATGSILGSPAYMSPEQARGHDVGKPSDVFSLGALLYHLVTGRPPFPGKDPLTVIASILSGEIPRPSQIAPHVGPALEAVIMRCLKRAPEGRYPDASAVHAALRTVFQGARGGDDGDTDGDPLRMFFDDRNAFTAALKTRVAAQAYENARLCIRRGDLTRALAEVNRTFAYQPGHSGAEALLGRISARRRWSTVGKVAAALVLLAGGGAAAAKLITARRATTVPTTPATVMAVPTAPIVPAPATEAPVAKATMAVAATEAPEKPSKRSGTRRPAGARNPAARVARASAEEQPVAPVAPLAATENGSTANAAPTTNAAPTEPPPETVVPPPVNSGLANASLVIRASEGFCSPSVDQQPAKIRPIYDHIAPGTHQIFCTMPGGAKHLAGTYELLPGTRPNLVVVPAPDGMPVLARPQ
jgi:serine/threonine-protein kinase